MPMNVIMPALELAQGTGKFCGGGRHRAIAKGDPIVEIETDKVTVAPRLEAYLPPNVGATVIGT